MSTTPTRTPPTLSLVIPAYNEARNLPALIEELRPVLQGLTPRFEVVVVDDGSRDDTLAVLESLCARHPELVMVELSRNFGKEAALSAGLAQARGDVVIVMDADGQHPVSLLPRLWDKWREGHDVVYAVRTRRDDQSALQSSMTGWFYRLVNVGSRVKIPPNAGDFRLMARPVVDALMSLPERHRFMKGMYAWVGFRSCPIDYEPLERRSGQSSFGWGGAISLAMTGLLAFSSKPLRSVGLLGMAIALLAFGYGVWVLVEYLLWGVSVPGYATIVTSLMFFSGLQLIGLGVLAEYVGRVYDEVKQRPLYLVRQCVGQGLDQPAVTERRDA